MGLEPLSVHMCVRLFILSNMNISETRWQITIKFYLKHHWFGGRAALSFGADRIRTLVSMTTDNCNRVIMWKTRFVIAFSQLFLIRSFSYLHVMMTYIRA